MVSRRETRVSSNDRTGQLLEAEFERLMMRVPGQGRVAVMKRIGPGTIGYSTSGREEVFVVLTCKDSDVVSTGSIIRSLYLALAFAADSMLIGSFNPIVIIEGAH